MGWILLFQVKVETSALFFLSVVKLTLELDPFLIIIQCEHVNAWLALQDSMIHHHILWRGDTCPDGGKWVGQNCICHGKRESRVTGSAQISWWISCHEHESDSPLHAFSLIEISRQIPFPEPYSSSDELQVDYFYLFSINESSKRL